MENPVHRQAGEIAFGDTDASGWRHFPNIFRYVEEAEHAFLRSRGIPVFDRAGKSKPITGDERGKPERRIHPARNPELAE